MTMLVAGHETTAAVLTWTLHLLSEHPDIADRVREEVRGPRHCTSHATCSSHFWVPSDATLHFQVDRVIGDRPVTVEDMKELRFTTRVINESMRLYPQPPVLIR